MSDSANASQKSDRTWAHPAFMKNDTTAALDVEPELSKADAEANRLPLLARRRVSAINKKQRQGRARSASFPITRVSFTEDDSGRPKAMSQPDRPQLNYSDVNLAALQDDTATEVEDIAGSLDKQHISPDDPTEFVGRSVRSTSSATTMSELSDEPMRSNKMARRLSSTSASPVHRMVMMQERGMSGSEGSLVEDSKPQPRRRLKRRWSTTAVSFGNDDAFSAELCDLGEAAFSPNIMYS